MSRYEFILNDNKTECQILLMRPAGKRIGTVRIKAPGAYEVDYAPSVMWLPVNQALAKLGLRSEEAEAQTMKELGY